MTNTAAISPVIADALEVVTEYGSRPFSEWVEVIANPANGVDILNRNSGQTVRVVEDDGTFRVYLFTNGRAMLTAGEMTFAGAFASSGHISATIASLL